VLDGPPTFDPRTWAAAAAALILALAVASLVPLRRALHVNALVALRAD
jgi:predicted lysophospholipase L1 biosynthesis ABC-type transport system permease subunit